MEAESTRPEMTQRLGTIEPPAGAIPFAGRIESKELQAATSKGAAGHLKGIFFLVAVMGLLLVATTFPSQGTQALLYLLPVALLPIFVLWLLRSLGQRQWKSSPLLRTEMRGWAHEQALHVENELVTSTLDWRVYAGFQATDAMVMLYQSSQAYNLFTRGLFASDEDWQGFRQLVETKIGRPRPQVFGKFPIALLVAVLALVFLLLVLATFL